MGDVVGERPVQPFPARPVAEVEDAVAVTGNQERGVPQQQIVVRQAHLDADVTAKLCGGRADRERDATVPAAAITASPRRWS
ncbi:hypothetical protein [Rhodococcus wratislaviensis]|uniref:hypothetical protein n=1 Tax=Rhodococcus wratislaviensis TaxID=44752 RepID=UPI0012DCEB9E|nr:hypothetical protein [Rhodococcus wratislaviensis]